MPAQKSVARQPPDTAGIPAPAEPPGRRLPIDVGQATGVGTVLLAVLFLVKVFAVAKYSLTTTTGLIAAAPLQVLLGTIGMYAYLVMPALALGVGWLGVAWWRSPDRSRFPAATWPLVAGTAVVTALLSPTEFFVTGVALLIVCVRLELGLRPSTRRIVVARWLLLAIAAVGVLYLFWPEPTDLQWPGLVLVAGTVVVDTVLVWRRLRPGWLRGHTFLALGSVAAATYLVHTIDVPWMSAQIFVLKHPVEISTQDKSIEPRRLSVVRVTVLEGYLLAKDDTEFTVLEADNRRIVRLQRDNVVTQLACHRDREQLPGKNPLLQELGGVEYNSHNITCATLRESLIPPRGLAYRSGDGMLVAAGWDGALGLWDGARQPLGTVPAPRVTEKVETAVETRQVPFPLAICGKWLAAAAVDGTVRLWDSQLERPAAPRQTLAADRTVSGRPASVSALAFSRTGCHLAVAAGDSVWIHAWDGKAYRKSGNPVTPKSGRRVNAVAFAQTDDQAPGQDRLVVGSADGRVTTWNPTAPGTEPVQDWQANDHEVYALAVTANGRTVAAAGGRREMARERYSEAYLSDASVWLYDVDEDRTWRLPASRYGDGKGHGGAVNALAFSPDKRWLASGSSDATVRLWDLEGAEKVRVLEGHTGAVNALAFHVDGTLASTGADQTIRIWRWNEPDGTPTIDVLSPPGPQRRDD